MSQLKFTRTNSYLAVLLAVTFYAAMETNVCAVVPPQALPVASYATMKADYETRLKEFEAVLTSTELAKLVAEQNTLADEVAKREHVYVEARINGADYRDASLNSSLYRFVAATVNNAEHLEAIHKQLQATTEPARQKVGAVVKQLIATYPKEAEKDKFLDKLKSSVSLTTYVTQDNTLRRMLWSSAQVIAKAKSTIIDMQAQDGHVLTNEEQVEEYALAAWFILERKIAFLKTRDEFEQHINQLIAQMNDPQSIKAIAEIIAMDADLTRIEQLYIAAKKSGSSPKTQGALAVQYYDVFFEATYKLTKWDEKFGQTAQHSQATLRDLRQGWPDLMTSDSLIKELSHKLSELNEPVFQIEQRNQQNRKIIDAQLVNAGKKQDDPISDEDLFHAVQVLLDKKAADSK